MVYSLPVSWRNMRTVYAVKTMSQTAAWRRLMTPGHMGCRLFTPKKSIEIDSSVRSGRSRFRTYGENESTGEMTHASPTTASMLKRLEPMMFPSTNSCSPRRADATALARWTKS